MIFSVAELISFTSEFVDLEPGDLISTGSPPGIGTFADRSLSLDEGDRVRMELLLGGHVACRLENGVVRYR
jgi:2-keto-4-pentenoate hydratase/2-oxohepta-3-ene-1,7-dioic acid hydratase in catechol pathway